MKLLWVKAGGMVPAESGGRIRSLQILKELAKRHSVTLFTYYARHAGDQHPELREFAEVVAIPIDIPPVRSPRDYRRFTQALISNQPYSLRVIRGPGGHERPYDQKAIRRRLAEVVARSNFDALICDFVFPAGVIDWSVPCKKLLFTHNVESLLWKQQFEMTHSLVNRFLHWREWRALAAAELRYTHLADHVLTVSGQDRAFFVRHVAPERITAIDTGVDAEYFQPSGPPARSGSLVFTGTMDWTPNEDGAQFFVSQILPRIHAEVPAAHFWIVGRSPSQNVQNLAGPQVHVTGRVDDIRPYIKDASVYVVPLRSGSGTRLKIFEAMAMGKAVVSTAIGAEGLPVTHGENILIADEAPEFARSVVRLLGERELSERIGKAARRLVETRFTWRAVATQVETILQNTVTREAADELDGAPLSGSKQP